MTIDFSHLFYNNYIYDGFELNVLEESIELHVTHEHTHFASNCFESKVHLVRQASCNLFDWVPVVNIPAI